MQKDNPLWALALAVQKDNPLWALALAVQKDNLLGLSMRLLLYLWENCEKLEKSDFGLKMDSKS